MVNVENKQRVLYFFTSCFPYNLGETFIENEIQYLSEGFSKVYIISNDLKSNYLRKVPSNIEVIRVRYELNFYEKRMCFVSLFSPMFWRELIHAKNIYNKNISFGIVKTALASIYNAKRLAKVYKSLNFINNNSLYYSYWTNDVSLALSLLKYKNKKLKCFSRIHGWDVFFEPSKYKYLPYRNFIADNLESIFSISKKGIDYCIGNWKIKNSSKIKLARLGVGKQIFLKQLSNNFLLVSCSNLISLKRVDLLIHSLAILKFKIKWVHFGDGEMFENLIRISKEILPDNVDFQFKGRVANKLVLEYYKENNPSLFINLSSSEGVPVSIMEAMSFGIPVIATNVGGNSEIVSEENGSLIEANPDPEFVSKKIIEFHELSKEDKNIKRKNAFDTWNVKYNADKNYCRFVEDILAL